MLIITATALSITYSIIQMTSVVIDKYHLCTKSANDVRIFWEWIKSILNIEKVFEKVSTTNKIKINLDVKKGTLSGTILQGREVKSQ